MLWLYILLGIVLFIALVMFIPITLRASYKEEFWCAVYIGFVKLQLVPAKPKKEKKKKNQKEEEDHLRNLKRKFKKRLKLYQGLMKRMKVKRYCQELRTIKRHTEQQKAKM